MNRIWDLKVHGDRTALIDETGVRISYAELDAESRALADAVGHRCLVFALCRNEPGSVLGYTAFLNHGIVPVMLNSHLDTALLENLLETYQLAGFADKKNRFLSQGMLKRVTMCLAFLADPPVLLLDEPTNGLDTAGLLMLKDRIRDARARGVVILISSHVLDFLSSINTQTLFLKGSESRMTDQDSAVSMEEEYRDYFGLR